MRLPNGARDALWLGQDALALARVAMTAGEAIHVDEIRCPVESTVITLRKVVVSSTADAGVLQEVLGGLSDVLAQLRARTAS